MIYQDSNCVCNNLELVVISRTLDVFLIVRSIAYEYLTIIRDLEADPKRLSEKGQPEGAWPPTCPK